MEFWALEHASDGLVALFAITVIGFFLFCGIVFFVDWIKKKIK